MKPLTINDLKRECEKQIKLGNGNKVIMLSDDDEGNGFHYCWYTFCKTDEQMLEEYMIDKSIAELEDTIILG